MSTKKMTAHEMRMLDVPEHYPTQRLILQVVQPGDGAMITQAKADSLERLRPWFPWAQEVGTVDDNELWARGMHVEFWNRTSVGFKMLLSGNDEIIGMIGIHNRKTAPMIWEIGYWLRTGYEGKGYMTEAAKACTQFAFEYLKADKMVIRADSRNFPSQNVARRCGYNFDGTMRWYERDHTNLEIMVDMCFFSVMREEDEEGDA